MNEIYGTQYAVDVADRRIEALVARGDWLITHDNGAIVCLRNENRLDGGAKNAVADRMSGNVTYS